MIKIYLFAGVLCITLIIGYGEMKYSKGYDKAISEQNARVIEIMRQNQLEKNKIQSKVKELQNALSSESWSSDIIPDSIKRMLSN